MNSELLKRIEELETRIKRLEQLLESQEDDTIYCSEPLEEELPEEPEDLPDDYCPGEIEGGNCFIDNDGPEEPTDEDNDQEIEREVDHD